MAATTKKGRIKKTDKVSGARITKSGGSRSSAGESPADRKKRARRILAILKKLYPDADCALKRNSALQLLVATILSAQSTDVTVNKVTPVLFDRYPTARDLATADPADIQKIIKSTGFFRQKAKSIINACSRIVAKYDGHVPDAMEELIELPGVARKTANVVLGTWFGINEGIAVDTHVGRLAHRLGLTWTSKDNKDAVKIEQDLMQLFPQKDWAFTSHALILHGRLICQARKPKCEECKLNKVCPSVFQFDNNGK